MHMHSGGGQQVGNRTVRLTLAAITLPLLVVTLVGLALLWPRGETKVGSLPLRGDSTLEVATVISIVPVGGGEFDPMKGADVKARLNAGPGAGVEVPVQVPAEIVKSGLKVGDRIQVLFTANAMGTGSPYVFYDFVRTSALLWLGALYLLVVAAVARWKGLAAVGGLLAALAITGFFVLPALMGGASPLLVVLVGASAMMFLAVYLAHGISVRTTTALLGTFVGLAITVVLGQIAVRGAHLTGVQGEHGLVLGTVFPGLQLRDVLLCGLVIASLGALNDVTITQASAVWELHAVNPELSPARLFAGGMRIGRDHIASTVYTLAFAYVGTALPMLMLAALIDRSFLDFLTASEIAEEIGRTLVSSVGLILAIPATTALAAFLAPKGQVR